MRPPIPAPASFTTEGMSFCAQAHESVNLDVMQRIVGVFCNFVPGHLQPYHIVWYPTSAIDSWPFQRVFLLDGKTAPSSRLGLFCLHPTIRGASNDRSVGNCSHHVHHLRRDLVDPHHDSLAAAFHADCPRSLRGDLPYLADLFADATGRRRARASLHPVKKRARSIISTGRASVWRDIRLVLVSRTD